MLRMAAAGGMRAEQGSHYAPSLRVERFACGWYGVGHTSRRHPGEMRGTVIGRQGRYRGLGAGSGGEL